MKPSTPKTQRCAIYTRVSTDQGLEQEFNSLHAQREAAQAATKPSSITIPWRPMPFRRKRELIQPVDGARPIRAEAREKLLATIARGRNWVKEILSDQAARIELIAAREGLPERSARSILSLAFLAPDIVKATVTGTLPRGFSVSRLIDLPANWAEQRSALGLPERS
jgi:hypothetical protein